MNCNKCNRELPEESQFCPYCGASVEETAVEEAMEAAAEETAVMEDVQTEEIVEAAAQEPAKKKPRAWLIVLAVLAGVVLAAVLTCAVLYSLDVNLKFWENNVSSKSVYTVTDEVAAQKADQVVATIGDEVLTNGELQIYYWETAHSFINDNYYYLSAMGLDSTQPFEEQMYPGNQELNWQQFFLEAALSSWQRYTTLMLLAEEAGFQLEADMQEFLDGFEATMLETAANAGFEDPLDWLAESCGPGVSVEGYLDYVHAYYKGTAYLISRYDDLEPAEADVEAYFQENEASFTASGVTKEGKYYDVRHILIEIEGGTTDAEGNVTYTDAEWQACQDKAQALLDQWKADAPTEDSFALLAMTNSADGGSSTNGGLYSQLTAETNFVQSFKDWYLDESRQPGDTGLVKSTYGYHIMYFSGSQEIWRYTATEQLLADRVSEMIDQGIEQHPMKTNYKKIILGSKEIT